MKPNLKVVKQPTPKVPKPYDQTHGLKQIERMRKALHAACVKYAKEGTEGTCVQDRIRTASMTSGISYTLIENEVRRK